MEEKNVKEPRFLHDCLMDWKNYPLEGINGETEYVEISDEQQREWKEEDYGCSEDDPATRERCMNYYLFKYDSEKLAIYEKNHPDRKLSDYEKAWNGLAEMINEDFLKSVTFVDWKNDFWLCPYPTYGEVRSHMESFMSWINNPEQRVAILKYLKDSFDYIYGRDKRKELLPRLNAELAKQKAAVKVYKEEERKRLQEQRKADKKEREQRSAEYILTLDEIIAYANDEAEGNAGAIRAMLRYFYTEKDGWDRKEVLKKIKSIGNPESTTVVNGDMVQEKHVATQIGTASYEK